MRNGQNKRMRGRNNNQHHHRKNQNPMARVFESNGPDVKIRGNPSHIAEKYIQLARDAQSSGDPIAAENYYQHAEHYNRLIAAAQEQFRQQNPHFNRPESDMRGDMRDDTFDDEETSDQQPMQGAAKRRSARASRSPFCRARRSRSRRTSISRQRRVRRSPPRRTAATSTVCRHSSPAAAAEAQRPPQQAQPEWP